MYLFVIKNSFNLGREKINPGVARARMRGLSVAQYSGQAWGTKRNSFVYRESYSTSMPIDKEFHKKLKPVGKHHEHYVWGQGKIGAAANDAKVKTDYESEGKKLEPIGIHGTFVAVDWDDCIADGACLPACPVSVFEWFKNPGASGQDQKLSYTDKSDPIREADCIWCMACVTVCPTEAIKVDQDMVSIHQGIKL